MAQKRSTTDYKVVEIEAAVHTLLVDFVANQAHAIHFGALLPLDGDDMTLAEGVSFLMRYSPEWMEISRSVSAGEIPSRV